LQNSASTASTGSTGSTASTGSTGPIIQVSTRNGIAVDLISQSTVDNFPNI